MMLLCVRLPQAVPREAKQTLTAIQKNVDVLNEAADDTHTHSFPFNKGNWRSEESAASSGIKVSWLE